MTEEIYGDVLFLINFSMDFLCLYIVGRLLHRALSVWRMLAAAVLGAVYGVVSLLFSLGEIGNTAVSLLVMLLMCAIAYSAPNIKGFLLSGVLFAGASMLLGGIMTAAFTMLGRYKSYMRIGGSIHTVYGDLPVWQFALLAAASAGVTWIIGRLFRRHRHIRSCEVMLGFGERETVLSCLVDSGNLAEEPMTGTPVIFVKAESADFLPSELLFALQSGVSSLDLHSAHRIRLIPTRTVGGEGIAVAVMPDRCRLLVNGCYEDKKALLAVDMTGGDFGGFPALVPEALL